MRTLDIVQRAGRSLAQAKARTLLTSLAIAVGAFTLTISIAAGEGSRQYADKLIGSNINPQALFIVKEKEQFSGSATSAGIQTYDDATTTSSSQFGQAVKQLTQDDIDQFSARSDLEAVKPIYRVNFKYFTVEGSDQQYTSELTTYDDGIRTETVAGELPPLGTQISNSSIVLPESFADTMKVSPNDLIGKKLTITLEKPAKAPTEAEINAILRTQGPAGLAKLSKGETKEVTYTVAAITKKSATTLTASTAMMVSNAQAKELAEFMTKGTDNFQKYSAVSARAKTGNDPEVIKADLEAEGYGARTAHDLQNLLFTIVNILQGIVAGFGILALLASIFGIINTQYISVLERTSQIGLMKALGMRGRDVARLFRYEAAWIGFLGGVIGAGLAWLLGEALNPWITKQLSLGDGNYLLIFKPIPIASLLLGLILVAVVAGYFPARKAARLDPIEALRTE